MIHQAKIHSLYVGMVAPKLISGIQVGTQNTSHLNKQWLKTQMICEMGKQTHVISGDCLSIHIWTLWPPGLKALVTHPMALQMEFPDSLV